VLVFVSIKMQKRNSC